MVAALLVLFPAGGVAPATAADGPTVTLSKQEAGTGGTITVSGAGWRPDALLMILICGQNMIGGTNACANADGRAVTTRSDGRFSKKLPVAEPPEPCPCVVHVATVTGETAAVDEEFVVAGHPVEPLPQEEGTGRIAVFAARLDGSSGLLTWFGAPPQRQLVLTVGNLGSAPVRNPIFQVGTSHGVFAPRWEEQQWRGTVPAGRKAQIRLPVELSAGAHGDYLVSLKYQGKVLTEQPWGVGRPWGVTLFWALLFIVVPAAVFRIGMAIVDHVRPRRPPPAPDAPGPTASRAPSDERPRAGRTAPGPELAWHDEPSRPDLSWPDSDEPPGEQAPPQAPPAHASAPSDDRPPSKGTP
ncbi:neocarzinostatin apoprotein domain-containing protein [Streptomyces sp. KR80]|uniref:neocarzinostatin apoprotein domain-containing protein n=1 Tax=Streptomyces sp. KR80 TaxID=3457426 RepID=UPI003FD5F313